MSKDLVVREPAKLQEWAKRIEACQNSGENVNQWCSHHGINAKTYYYWHRKVKNMYKEEVPGTNSFYEIPQVFCSPTAGTVTGAIIVGNIRAEVYQGADVETLASIIKAMQLC